MRAALLDFDNQWDECGCHAHRHREERRGAEVVDYRLEVPALPVADVDRAEVSEVFHDAGGVFHHAGTQGRVSGPAPDHQSYGSFASFSDPDGNGWFLQEITTCLPGR